MEGRKEHFTTILKGIISGEIPPLLNVMTIHCNLRIRTAPPTKNDIIFVTNAFERSHRSWRSPRRISLFWGDKGTSISVPPECIKKNLIETWISLYIHICREHFLCQWSIKMPVDALTALSYPKSGNWTISTLISGWSCFGQVCSPSYMGVVHGKWLPPLLESSKVTSNHGWHIIEKLSVIPVYGSIKKRKWQWVGHTWFTWRGTVEKECKFFR